MRGGRAGIATPRAASVSRCMRCAVWSGRVPRGPRWTGPTALAIYPRGGVPRNVVARSASAISAAGGRGVRRVRRKRAGADTRGAQLWTPGGDGTSARGAGAMGSFKYKWEDLQKLVLLTFNNTTAAVSPPSPPLRCPAPLPSRGHRTSPGVLLQRSSAVASYWSCRGWVEWPAGGGVRRAQSRGTTAHRVALAFAPCASLPVTAAVGRAANGMRLFAPLQDVKKEVLPEYDAKFGGVDGLLKSGSPLSAASRPHFTWPAAPSACSACS